MNITTEQLKKVLDNHALWINNPKEGTRADLYGANLNGANLNGADLRGANFTVELKDAVNLRNVVHDQSQIPFLALNPSFLQSVQRQP